MLTFRVTNRSYTLGGDLLKTMTNLLSMLISPIHRIENYFMRLQKNEV